MKRILSLLIVILSVNVTLSQWTQSGFLNGRQVNYFGRNGIFLFAGTAQNGVYRSTNDGDEWLPFNNGVSSSMITGIITNNFTTYLSTLGGGVFKSDSGNYFLSINGNLIYFGVDVLAVKNNIILACMDNSTVYKTTNGGNFWFESSSGIGNVKFSAAGVLNNFIFLGTTDYGIYKTTDDGNNWYRSNSGLGNLSVKTIKVSGNKIYCGTQNGMYVSSDNGSNWIQIQTNFSNNDIKAIEVSGNYIFAGTNGAGIYKSSNGGLNWIAINEGLFVLYINTIFKDLNYLFAGAGTGGALRRPLSQIISVEKISSELPADFELGQNYPNPFNSVTSIKFKVTGAATNPLQRGIQVVLGVFDINGKEIAILINEKLEPGFYETRFDAGELSSGVYFYRIIAEDGKYISQVRKMIILK